MPVCPKCGTKIKGRPIAMISSFGLGEPDILYASFDNKKDANCFAEILKANNCHIKHPGRYRQHGRRLRSYPYTETWQVEFQCPDKKTRDKLVRYQGPNR